MFSYNSYKLDKAVGVLFRNLRTFAYTTNVLAILK